MSRFYAIDEANTALPEVERILGALLDQREELIALRMRFDLTQKDLRRDEDEAG